MLFPNVALLEALHKAKRLKAEEMVGVHEALPSSWPGSLVCQAHHFKASIISEGHLLTDLTAAAGEAETFWDFRCAGGHHF